MSTGFKFITKKVEPKVKAQGDKKVEYEIRVKQFDESPEGFSAVLAEVGGENGVVTLVNSMYDTKATQAGTAPVRTAKADANIAERIESGIKAAFEYIFEERGMSKAAKASLIDDFKAKAKNATADELEKHKAELFAALGY
jgi:osmotically-inducible protein OsmY